MTSLDFRTDPLFLRNQFSKVGAYEMPRIFDCKLPLDQVQLIGYDKIADEDYEKIVHFFLDDYKFNVLWNKPDQVLERLKPFRAVLSPQFSLYTEMPRAVQIHQVFKSRWCGAFLQSKGLYVIPSLVWGDYSTFDFCFDGIDIGAPVAVSTIGMRTEKALFMAGYERMLIQLQPRKIICYGKPFDEMSGPLVIVNYAETNNLTTTSFAGEQSHLYYKVSCGYILNEKGGGLAGGTGNAGSMPKFPGWDKTQAPTPKYEWRGKGTPSDGKGNWYNPETKEWLHPDLDHAEPYGPHWDYGIRGQSKSYRIYPDNSYEEKAFIAEEVVKI